MQRTLSALVVALSLSVGTVLVRAQDEQVGIQYFWPDDGPWFHYVLDSTTYAFYIWVYCSGGVSPCQPPQEWVQGYDFPPSPYDGWIEEPVRHRDYRDRNDYYAQSEHPWGETFFWGNIKAAWNCDDARSALNQEWVDNYLGNNMWDVNHELPGCGSWDGGWATGPDYPNFSWSELNGHFQQGNPHGPYGIVRQGMINGLLATRNNWGEPIPLSSGFRCPHGNASLPGSVFNSWHVHGRAADMCHETQPDCGWTETTFNQLKATAEATGTIESLGWNYYSNHHYHAAW